jgi:uncharacterized membrane protein YdbT with pleckstrin-like domain
MNRKRGSKAWRRYHTYYVIIAAALIAADYLLVLPWSAIAFAVLILVSLAAANFAANFAVRHRP